MGPMIEYKKIKYIVMFIEYIETLIHEYYNKNIKNTVNIILKH